MIEKIPHEDAKNLHWYVQINGKESGPYSYIEVLTMVHNKDINHEHSLVYRGLGGWHPLKSFKNFEKESILEAFELFDYDPDDNDEVHYRRSVRVPVSTQALVVMGDYCFKCECIDISSGGCLIKLPRGKIRPESYFGVHFYRNRKLNLEAFNVKGEAVRVVSAAKLLEGSSYYDLIGVQFDIIKKSEKEQLKEMLRGLVFKTLSEVEINRVLKRQSSLAA